MNTICKNKLAYLVFGLSVLTGFGLFSADSKSTEEAFWQKKPKVMKAVLEERKVPVAVKVADTDDDKQQHMDLQGVGLVQAPSEFAGPWLTNYNNLKRVSKYTKEVKWNPKTQILFLHTAALGYHAKMYIEMLEKKDEKGTRIDWSVKRGFLKNLSGQLLMHEQSFGKTLFSIQANGNFESTNIPKVFLKFGFEVFIQKFAEKIRSLIEKDFKNGQKLSA